MIANQFQSTNSFWIDFSYLAEPWNKQFYPRSTSMAEFIASSHAAKETNWIKKLLHGTQFTLSQGQILKTQIQSVQEIRGGPSLSKWNTYSSKKLEHKTSSGFNIVQKLNFLRVLWQNLKSDQRTSNLMNLWTWRITLTKKHQAWMLISIVLW